MRDVVVANLALRPPSHGICRKLEGLAEWRHACQHPRPAQVLLLVSTRTRCELCCKVCPHSPERHMHSQKQDSSGRLRRGGRGMLAANLLREEPPKVISKACKMIGPMPSVLIAPTPNDRVCVGRNACEVCYGRKDTDVCSPYHYEQLLH